MTAFDGLRLPRFRMKFTLAFRRRAAHLASRVPRPLSSPTEGERSAMKGGVGAAMAFLRLPPREREKRERDGLAHSARPQHSWRAILPHHSRPHGYCSVAESVPEVHNCAGPRARHEAERAALKLKYSRPRPPRLRPPVRPLRAWADGRSERLLGLKGWLLSKLGLFAPCALGKFEVPVRTTRGRHDETTVLRLNFASHKTSSRYIHFSY